MRLLQNYIFLLALVLFAGCQKQLDLVPQGAPSSGNFWKTSEDAVAGINSIYQLYSNNNMYGGGSFYYMSTSDDIACKATGNADRFKYFQLDGNESETRTVWSLHYQAMKRANDAIRNVPAISMEAKLKDRILGEAYFNHAIMHLELAYKYGDQRAGIPIPDRERPENIYVPRPKSVAENYAYIVADLVKAAELLPYFSELGKADYGRAHKTAAWAYLARTYLYARDWAKSQKYADMVISSKQHKLLENFTDVFKISGNWSSEYIWSVTNSAQFPNSVGCIFPGILLEDKGWGVYNGWGSFYPTKELYDAYESIDKRLPVTILKTGDKFMFFGLERSYNVGSFTVSSSNRSGYQFNKYMEPYTYANPTGVYVNSNGNRPTTAMNVPLLRYADVLLMRAEAALMQGQSGDAEINAIRRRAGLLPLSGATLADLKKERRCEFAGEWTDRHWDLVRWGDAQQTYAKPLHHADGREIYTARTFNPAKHHVWPIPLEEIRVSNGTLPQNEGW
ncbi:RagB/SusD family nutrient uptake outer membrane protein [Pedobacter sp. MC2016-24]|uniref:RagB/SusD family nutrient uptake outer membrane protein n=1 Tax=Pedobacter sp. MC2016-24 TaxID=2780090 RepID=UPI0018825E8F|nr:RagB/SusD family nutrient uptake outer membrane protein [Pedobacter sp. MC2016-24]MBE9601591.1 RagB/SusD family nutrient uptake outer membrane protein [Pedobacter sp. MC2016-24]